MADFSYARGRIGDSLQFIAREMDEFEKEYRGRPWQEYQQDAKLQKLMERTVENILTALVEVCGTVLADKGIAAENYAEVLSKTAEYFGFAPEDQNHLAKLAAQRNRLAHRYLDFKWQAIRMFVEQKEAIQKLLQKILSMASS